VNLGIEGEPCAGELGTIPPAVFLLSTRFRRGVLPDRETLLPDGRAPEAPRSSSWPFPQTYLLHGQTADPPPYWITMDAKWDGSLPWLR